MVGRFRKLVAACVVGLSAPAAFAQDMPAFIAGRTFEAVGVQFDGNAQGVIFNFSAVVDPKKPTTATWTQADGTVDCSADLFAVEHDDTHVVFKERLTSGKDRCADLGYTEVSSDQIVGGPVYAWSPTRDMHPQLARGMLFDPGVGGDFAARRALVERLAPMKPWIYGSYESTKGFLGRCIQPMPVSEHAFLPQDARGTIALWSVPTEEGGKTFVVYEAGIPAQLVWKEVHPWAEGSFVVTDGLFGLEGRVFIAPETTPDGLPGLYVAEDGEARIGYDHYVRCGPA